MLHECNRREYILLYSDIKRNTKVVSGNAIKEETLPS